MYMSAKETAQKKLRTFSFFSSIETWANVTSFVTMVAIRPKRVASAKQTWIDSFGIIAKRRHESSGGKLRGHDDQIDATTKGRVVSASIVQPIGLPERQSRAQGRE